MHQPSSGMGGSASDIKIQAQQSLHIKKVLLDLIAEHTGQPVEQVEADADRDRWFTAEQAMEYGLVDQVVKSARDAADEGRPAHDEGLTRHELLHPAVGRAHVLRLPPHRPLRASCSRTASSTSARRSPTTSPTP